MGHYYDNKQNAKSYLENSFFQVCRTDNGQTIKKGPGQFSDP